MKIQITEQAISKLNLRSTVIKEIRTTEETYLNGLSRLNGFWKENLIEFNFLKEEEAQQIFQHLPLLIQCHTIFYSNLTKKGETISSQIADVFLSSFSFFGVASFYIGSYNSSLELIAKKLTNPSYKDIMKQICNNNPNGSGESIESLLITPVQRAPRYILLIRELIKKTPSCHLDSEFLPIAESVVDQETRKIEDLGAKARDTKFLLDLEERLKPACSIFSEKREVFMSAPIKVMKPIPHDGTFLFF